MTLCDQFSLLKKSLRSSVLPLLADLRLAIALLLAIAVFSISGTVIEQEQSAAFYQANYPEDPALFGFLSWKVLLFLGLDHVYSTWWFLSLLVLFGLSLGTCTFLRQWPALKAARTWQFYEKARQFDKLALSTTLSTDAFEPLAIALEQQRYRVFRSDNAIYARKGIAGRIGPIIVHASMILVLLGSIWGAFTGFMAQELIPSQSEFKVQNIVRAGIWSGSQIPKDWSVRVNRFWIDYTPDGIIDQFYSDLSVLDSTAQEVTRKTIHVNEPLRYRGVTLYQTDWGISAVKVRINKSPTFQIPMAQLQTQVEGNRLWGTWVPIKPDLSAGISLLSKDLQGSVVVYDTAGQLVGSLRTGMSLEVDGVTLHLDEVLGSTGLQIKADPGIPFIYAGFGLLMIGVVMSYVSHSQCWVLLNDDLVYFGGRTNRAQVQFEQEFLEIIAVTEATTASACAPTQELESAKSSA